MMHTLVRAPAGPAELAADALRVLALLGIVIAAIGWGAVAGWSLALVAGGMVVPRLLGVRPSVDIAFGVVMLVAVWSSVLDIYLSTRWWDLPVHFLANGLCAAVAYILLERLAVVADAASLPRPVLSTVVVTTAVGVTLGVLWEIFEWIGHTFIDEGIFVGYTDSIGDLFWGGLGAVLAGCSMRYLAAQPQGDDGAGRVIAGGPRP